MDQGYIMLFALVLLVPAVGEPRIDVREPCLCAGKGCQIPMIDKSGAGEPRLCTGEGDHIRMIDNSSVGELSLCTGKCCHIPMIDNSNVGKHY